jgi:hypothetical protein
LSLLILKDRGGNGDQYSLIVPDEMDHWKMSAFLEYVQTGNEQLTEEGFLVKPFDELHFETFRQIANKPELSLNLPLVYCQNDRVLSKDDRIDVSRRANMIHLDRESKGVVPDGSKISIEEINRNAFASCKAIICEAFDSLFDFQEYPIAKINGQAANSLADLTDNFTESLSEEQQLRFFLRVANIIHAAPFENISKILGSITLRSGYEMWKSVAGSFGGVCVEKTSMLMFLCDILSVNTTPVIGSDSVIPDDFEDVLKDYLACGGETDLPVWVQHHLLEIEICGENYLVDTTGGNIPLTFLKSSDADVLIKNGIRARMVYRVERLNLRRVSKWAGDALLTITQYHVRDLHMQYVFKQGLGLHIDSEFFIAVYFDWGKERSAMMQNYYSSLAKQVGFGFPRFIHAENLSSIPDAPLQNILSQTLKAVRTMFNDENYTGDFTFVIQPMTPNFWTQARISDDIKKIYAEIC